MTFRPCSPSGTWVIDSGITAADRARNHSQLSVGELRRRGTTTAVTVKTAVTPGGAGR